ncbi:MAG: hypothetical protein AAB074_15585 [Planctomycetota bacterium]
MAVDGGDEGFGERESGAERVVKCRDQIADVRGPAVGELFDVEPGGEYRAVCGEDHGARPGFRLARERRFQLAQQSDVHRVRLALSEAQDRDRTAGFGGEHGGPWNHARGRGARRSEFCEIPLDMK